MIDTNSIIIKECDLLKIFYDDENKSSHCWYGIFKMNHLYINIDLHMDAFIVMCDYNGYQSHSILVETKEWLKAYDKWSQ